jgi:hypothetical protein
MEVALRNQETNRAEMEARLVREGWINVGGAKHD